MGRHFKNSILQHGTLALSQAHIAEFKKPQVAYLQPENLAKCNPDWQLVRQHLHEQASFEKFMQRSLFQWTSIAIEEKIMFVVTLFFGT